MSQRDAQKINHGQRAWVTWCLPFSILFYSNIGLLTGQTPQGIRTILGAGSKDSTAR